MAMARVAIASESATVESRIEILLPRAVWPPYIMRGVDESRGRATHRVPPHHHDAPAPRHRAGEQRGEVDDLFPWVDGDFLERLAVDIVHRQVKRGESSPPIRVALMHELDEMAMALLVERDRQEGRQLT